jgi:hypothetical protein
MSVREHHRRDAYEEYSPPEEEPASRNREERPSHDEKKRRPKEEPKEAKKKRREHIKSELRVELVRLKNLGLPVSIPDEKAGVADFEREFERWTLFLIQQGRV